MSGEQQNQQPLNVARSQPTVTVAVKRSSRLKARLVLARIKPSQQVDEMSFQCEQCDESFVDASHLKNHQNSAHLKKKKPYNCSICGETFHKNSISRHMRRKHAHVLSITDNMPDEPKELGGTRATEGTAGEKRKPKRKTLLQAQGNLVKKYRCETCHASYASASELLKHKRRDCHPVVPKSSAENAKNSMDLSGMKVVRPGPGENENASQARGMLSVKKKKPSKKISRNKGQRGIFECHVCHTTFTLPYNLKRHKSRKICQLNLRKAKDMEGLKMGSAKAKRKHVKKTAASLSRNNENKQGQFQCDICSATFSCNKYLSRHKRRSKTCRNLQLKSTNLTNNMKQSNEHENSPGTMGTPSTSKKQDVGKKLRKKSSKKISGSETGSRPSENLVCRSCAESFTSTDLLKDHQIKTHNKKIYNCVDCTAWFTRRYYLINHATRMHQRKIHECPDCSIRFLTYQEMMKHRKTVHLRAKNKCNTCKVSFANQKSLRRHQIKTGHGMQRKTVTVKNDSIGKGKADEGAVVQQGSRKSERMRKPKLKFSPSASPEKENREPQKTPAISGNNMDAESLAVKAVEKTPLRKRKQKLERSPTEDISLPLDLPGGSENIRSESGSSNQDLDVQEDPPMAEEQEETGQQPQKQRCNESFFLHCNRYDPDSV